MIFEPKLPPPYTPVIWNRQLYAVRRLLRSRKGITFDQRAMVDVPVTKDSDQGGGIKRRCDTAPIIRLFPADRTMTTVRWLDSTEPTP